MSEIRFTGKADRILGCGQVSPRKTGVRRLEDAISSGGIEIKISFSSTGIQALLNRVGL